MAKPPTASPQHIMLIAGEPSGDALGGKLMQALREKNPQLRFSGVGDSAMLAQGLQPVFAMRDITAFGIFEVLPRLPLLLWRLHQAEAAVRRKKPDALIMIDAPGFNFTLGHRLRHSGVPLIHYAAPTVWAWRPWRAKKIAGFLHHLMALLPFEPPYFTRENLPCTFVGHPVLETAAAQKIDKAAARRRLAVKLGIPEDAPILVVLPGSRSSELKRLLPIFAETVARLKTQLFDLQVILPTLPDFAEQVAAACASWPMQVQVITDEADKYDAFAAGTVALAASGTVALELALAELPAIIAYKISPLTWRLYRHLVTVSFASLPNIMHQKSVQPEFMQADCTADNLTQATLHLLTNAEARQAQQQDLRAVRDWLGGDQAQPPSMRAAECVMQVLAEKQQA